MLDVEKVRVGVAMTSARQILLASRRKSQPFGPELVQVEDLKGLLARIELEDLVLVQDGLRVVFEAGRVQIVAVDVAEATTRLQAARDAVQSGRGEQR